MTPPSRDGDDGNGGDGNCGDGSGGDSSGDDGFGAFFRRYTKTWVHAVATAALTGLGLLTFVHRFFAVVAVAAYVVPPVALYLADPSSIADPPATGNHSATSPRETERHDESPGDATPSVAEAGDRDGSDDAADPAWTAASVPTDESLADVAVGDGRAYAVGDDGGVFATRDGPGDWTTVLDDGPGADANALRGVDAAGDGGIWFAGDGGALGRLDPATDRHVDHSAPGGDTSSIADVTAASDGTTEVVLRADGSGRIRRGEFRDGELAWDEPVTPGSGSSVVGIHALDATTAYVCDSNQSVFRTRDGGRSFERIGVDGADGTLTDVTAFVVAAGEACAASADDGVVHRFDGTNWTPDSLGGDEIRAVAAYGAQGLACSDGGVVYERGAAGSDRKSGSQDEGTDWRREPTPATVPLRGCALDDSIAVAVGDDGTVVARSVAHSSVDR